MASNLSRLPSRFPVGTKFVIEGRREGRKQVFSRHLEFPDGTLLRLPARSGSAAKATQNPRRRAASGR